MVKRISPWAWSSKLDKYTRFSSLFDHGQEEIFFFLDHDWASIANAQGFQTCLIMTKKKLNYSLPWLSKLDKCTRFSGWFDHGQGKVNWSYSLDDRKDNQEMDKSSELLPKNQINWQ